MGKMRASRVEYAVLAGGVVNLRVYPRTADNNCTAHENVDEVDVKKREIAAQQQQQPQPVPEKVVKPKGIRASRANSVTKVQNNVTTVKSQTGSTKDPAKPKVPWACNIANCDKRPRRRVRLDDSWGPAGPRCFRHGANAYARHNSTQNNATTPATAPTTAPTTAPATVVEKKPQSPKKTISNEQI